MPLSSFSFFIFFFFFTRDLPWISINILLDFCHIFDPGLVAWMIPPESSAMGMQVLQISRDDYYNTFKPDLLRSPLDQSSLCSLRIKKYNVMVNVSLRHDSQTQSDHWSLQNLGSFHCLFPCSGFNTSFAGTVPLLPLLTGLCLS